MTTRGGRNTLESRTGQGRYLHNSNGPGTPSRGASDDAPDFGTAQPDDGFYSGRAGIRTGLLALALPLPQTAGASSACHTPGRYHLGHASQRWTSWTKYPVLVMPLRVDN